MLRTQFDPTLGELLPDLRAGYNRRDDRYVESLLEGAIRRSPWRIDLRLALANRHIQTESPEISLKIWGEIHALAPRDTDTLVYLAHWNRFAKRKAEQERFLRLLYDAAPARAARLVDLWDNIDKWLAASVSSALPPRTEETGSWAVVVLGYVLNPDGSLAEEMLRRLEKAREAAAAYPEAPLIVSGGVPRGGRVEAEAMRDWLVARGVARERIFEEGYSRNIVENVYYSRQILDMLRAGTVLAITGGTDVRRTGICFEEYAKRCGSAWRTLVCAGQDETGEGTVELLKIYRDSLRAWGMLLMGIFPQLAER